MTPKEKAKELVNKLLKRNYIYEAALDAARFSVDELLYFADTQANGLQKGKNVRADWINYFNDVKHELSLL
jgi:hypothetical protein